MESHVDEAMKSEKSIVEMKKKREEHLNWENGKYFYDAEMLPTSGRLRVSAVRIQTWAVRIFLYTALLRSYTYCSNLQRVCFYLNRKNLSPPSKTAFRIGLHPVPVSVHRKLHAWSRTRLFHYLVVLTWLFCYDSLAKNTLRSDPPINWPKSC